MYSIIIAIGSLVGILVFVIWGYKYFEQQGWFLIAGDITTKTKVELDKEKIEQLKDYYRKNCIAEKVFDKELNIVTSSYYSANMATLEDVFNILGVESIIEDVRNEVSQHEYKQILDENGYAKYVKVVEQYEGKNVFKMDGVNNRCFVNYRHEL